MYALHFPIEIIILMQISFRLSAGKNFLYSRSIDSTTKIKYLIKILLIQYLCFVLCEYKNKKNMSLNNQFYSGNRVSYKYILFQNEEYVNVKILKLHLEFFCGILFDLHLEN